MIYQGEERRRAGTSPVQHRRIVTPEILRQVKGIELRTRGLVSSLFAGEYRSVFRGQGIEFAGAKAADAGRRSRPTRQAFQSGFWNRTAPCEAASAGIQPAQEITKASR